MNLRHLFAFCALCSLQLQPLKACFAMLPLDSLVADNAVIVQGKIVKVDVAPAPKAEPEQQSMDTGYILVSEVLKDQLADQNIRVGDKLPLRFPSKNRKLMISTDISYSKGQSGIWLLEFRDGAFYATYPGDFQSNDRLQDIKNLIQKSSS